MFRRPRFGLIAVLLGAAIFGQGLYMGGKARLAQNLLERAWSKTAESGDVNLPWSWMDAHPVARLKIEGDKGSHIVLNTDSGQALAFGPAVIGGTENRDLLGIAAHKNTQFQILQTLKAGQTLTLERPKGDVLTFLVTHSEILDSRNAGLPIEEKSQSPSRLALVTCYPFNALSFNGPMRYVVYADRISDPRMRQ